MFAFFSLLVETFAFNTIYISFLIVGHTHSSIDQYFGVLTGAIKNTQYIASPLSLLELLKIAHNNEKIDRRPAIARQIIVYYNFKEAITPYLNKQIKVIKYYG